MRLDGRATVSKAVGDVVRRPGIMFPEESRESVRTQKRIVRTNADKAVEIELRSRLYETVEYVVLVSPVATDTRFAGNLNQYIKLRAVRSGKDNCLAGASRRDIAD